MHLRFSAGFFRPTSSYAIGDFELVTIGVITTLPPGISYGGIRFETAVFAQR
jgi:hypothetical protein